jgi:phosphatidylglycerophosphate synthase
VLIGLVVIRLTVGKVKIRPHYIGKVATVLQMATVLWLLLKWDTGDGTHWVFGLTLGAAICTGISALLYVRDGMRQLSASPSSFPSNPPQKLS